MSLVTKIFVTFGRTSKAHNISAFKQTYDFKGITVSDGKFNILLPNQKLYENVTIIKFELVWEGRYVTII